MKSPKGFTLVEILIVVAMVGVIMGAVYSLYITTQRTSYTQDETVEVQQNLRIAMDSFTRDARMAGMLVDYGNNVFPVQAADDDAGPNASDRITLNMASATGNYARIDADTTPAGTSAVFPLTPSTTVDNPVTATSGVASRGDGDVLQLNDLVRIIRPFQNTQPSGEATFTVTALVRQEGLKGVSTAVPTPPTTPPTVTLQDTSGASLSGVEFKRGDMIAKVNGTDATTPSPNTVQYAVVIFAAAPATLTTDPNCPVNQRCLARRINNEISAGGDPVWQIVAQNISNFQLRYLLDDNSISTGLPTDRSLIKGLMVAISGETVTTRMLSGNVPKTRQLTSVVKLRNRR